MTKLYRPMVWSILGPGHRWDGPNWDPHDADQPSDQGDEGCLWRGWVIDLCIKGQGEMKIYVLKGRVSYRFMY